MYKYWHEPPPVKLDCYFFNWTNPEEFLNHSSIPKFEEVGPYSYLEYPRKSNVTFHDNNSTVTYKKLSKYIFDPESSVGKMTDIVTTANLLALSASKQSQSFNILKIKGVELGLAFFGQKFHTRQKASELLFEGYEDSIIPIAVEIVKFLEMEVPFEDRFGWFYKVKFIGNSLVENYIIILFCNIQRNESSRLTGEFVADTSLPKLSQMRNWSVIGKPKFLETNCGSYRGASSDGLFPPMLAKTAKTISIFAHEMCRSLELDYVGDVEVNGIMGRKFVSGDRMIDK